MKQTLLSLLVLGSLSCATAYATDADPWTIKATPQASFATFSNSPTRDSVSTMGVYADAQYLEHGGFTAGISHTSLKMKLGAPTLQQNALFLSARGNFNADSLSGRVTLRADVHRANNNDATNETNGVTAFAPQVSFLNYDKTLYLDMGYARSSYGNSNIGNGSLTVSQWTPTIGFGFNQAADWLQLRLYDVSSSNTLRSQKIARTDALDLKWTHYLIAGGWKPEQILVGALFGKRMYAVDGDAGMMYNLSDVQRGSASLGALWRLSDQTRILLQSGSERFENATGVRYSATYLYAGLTQQW